MTDSTTSMPDDDLAPSWVFFLPHCTPEQRDICEAAQTLGERYVRRLAEVAEQLREEHITELQALVEKFESGDWERETRRREVSALDASRKQVRR